MKRQHQLLLIIATVGFSWLAMQVIHELGHVAAAWTTGGRIAHVELHPTSISHTLLATNPQPQLVAWMGPLVGVIVPLLAWSVVRWKRYRGWYVWQFFAGFCLVANGVYMAAGAVFELGDAADLVQHGATRPPIWLFGLASTALGFALWNRLGVHFGFGLAEGSVDKLVADVVSLIMIAIVALELMLA